MQYAILALIVAACDVLVLTVYAALGSRAARLLVGSNIVWVDRFYGAALLMLSCVLITQSFQSG